MARVKMVSSKGKKVENKSRNNENESRRVDSKARSAGSSGRDVGGTTRSAGSTGHNTANAARRTAGAGGNAANAARSTGSSGSNAANAARSTGSSGSNAANAARSTTSAGSNAANAARSTTSAGRNAKNGSNSTRKRKTAVKTAIIIVVILMFGFLALVFSLGFYVRSLDTVYPNVWVDGVRLAGLTFDDAIQALIEAGYEDNADNVSATILFPDGSSFTINGDEVGFSLDAQEAAVAAYEYGRGDSFFGNEIAFIRAYFTRSDLRDVSMSKFDEEAVRVIAFEHTKAYNALLVDDTYDISGDSITIVKGITFNPADEAAVHQLAVSTILEAMNEKAHLTAEYTSELSEAKEVDLQMLFDSVFVQPVSAQYDPGTYSASKSSTGTTFDLEAARVMLDNAGMGEQIVIKLITLEPEVTEEEIESVLFRDIIAESTTYISGTNNRLNNIVLSSAAIDGTILNPGDIFSFNEIVGQRTADRGYMEAGAYVGDLVVTEIGGGICQTSSTIYYTLLKADLEVLERRPHGMTVGYLPLGGDATINWGTIDLKFRNNTDYPIRVDITIVGRDITVKIIGTKLDDHYIKLDYTLISSTPVQVITREDETVPQGQTRVYTEGSTGYVVETYKHYYDGNDNHYDTVLVGRSTYYVQNRVILVSPEPQEGETDEPDEPDNPDNPDEPDEPDNPDEPDDPDVTPDGPTDPPEDTEDPPADTPTDAPETPHPGPDE